MKRTLVTLFLFFLVPILFGIGVICADYLHRRAMNHYRSRLSSLKTLTIPEKLDRIILLLEK